VYGGKPLAVLNWIQQSDDWELVVSPAMMAELLRVLLKSKGILLRSYKL
jgi:hypothetical protein